MSDPVLGPSAGSDRINKPPTPSSASHGSAGALNPRSCVTCRKRKVRCDKHHPCSNCAKAHIECIFPAPGRAPRRPRKPPDGELLSRLRRLEGVVQSLGASVDEDGHPITNSAGVPEQRSLDGAERSSEQHRGSLDHSFGKLVISEGKSRYVNNTFWAGLGSELEDLKVILDESSDSDADYPTPETDSVSSPSHQGFLFGAQSFHANELHSIHPQPHVIMAYWQAYVDNFDAVMKIFHVPTMTAAIESVKDNPARGHKGMESLLFAVYYAAVNSMSEEQCRNISGESKEMLVGRYRFATEQALARANFLVTEELVVFQAFIILVMCLRRTEDSRLIWSLCGLVIRIAVTLGLHRDGTNFGLSPFETEIRRRAFWNMMSLDMRTSEDHGCDATIMDHAYDTKYPLNIEDSDIDPSTTETPTERTGITGMSFCLARYEIISTLRKLAFRPTPPESPELEFAREITTQDKERWIRACQETLDRRFLQHCDLSIPYHWCVYTVSKLVTGKMWLVLYNPFLREDKGAGLPQAIKDRLFEISLQSLECSLDLDTSPAITKWAWLFRSYNQWHALAYTLLELCTRTSGPNVDRAWRVVDATIAEYGGQLADTKKGHLWKLLRKLVEAAKLARAHGLAQDMHAAQGQQGFGGGAERTSPAAVENRALHEVRGAASNGFMTPESMDTKPFAPGTNEAMAAAYARGGHAFKAEPMDSTPAADSTLFAQHAPMMQSNWPVGASGGGAMMAGAHAWPQPPRMGAVDAPRDPTLARAPAYADAGGAYFASEMPGLSGADSDAGAGPLRAARQSMGSDPMVSGSDAAGNIWEDWDDMMREFELESGQDGALSRWSSRPMMNEAWL